MKTRRDKRREKNRRRRIRQRCSSSSDEEKSSSSVSDKGFDDGSSEDDKSSLPTHVRVRASMYEECKRLSSFFQRFVPEDEDGVEIDMGVQISVRDPEDEDRLVHVVKFRCESLAKMQMHVREIMKGNPYKRLVLVDENKLLDTYDFFLLLQEIYSCDYGVIRVSGKLKTLVDHVLSACDENQETEDDEDEAEFTDCESIYSEGDDEDDYYEDHGEGFKKMKMAKGHSSHSGKKNKEKKRDREKHGGSSRKDHKRHKSHHGDKKHGSGDKHRKLSSSSEAHHVASSKNKPSRALVNENAGILLGETPVSPQVADDAVVSGGTSNGNIGGLALEDESSSAAVKRESQVSKKKKQSKDRTVDKYVDLEAAGDSDESCV